jgi:acetyl-CoA synthetase
MNTPTLIPVDVSKAAPPSLTHADYQALYAASVQHPEQFWFEQGKMLDWIKPYSRAKNTSFSGDVSIRWFEDGVLNVCSNCVDRHLPARANQTALIWEGDNPNEQQHITYAALHEQVCRFANVLRSHGVKKGDRVTIYLPMIIEAVTAMLACARIGAVHSVVFGGFSPDSLRDRLLDCNAKLLITADYGVRGGKKIPLKHNADLALKQCPAVTSVLVVRRTGDAIDWHTGRDHWLHEAMANAAPDCPAEPMGAEDPLFILYTSGSTGKPKGVLHTTGGYLLYAAMTHKHVFDYRDGEIYWCTADVGWVTGHSYIVYGPLANGATSLVFEGVPNYPDSSRFWQVIEKHRVTIFYTAPTAIRALMRDGDAPVKTADRSSLRLLASVGEPINPEAWLWYWRVVGEERCPVIDTWWQTETGGHMITPLPYATALKPGSATLPFFGVQPVLVDNDGKEIHGAGEGNLCLTDSWPGQARSLYGDHGYYWITGRVDDVINVAGHRLGTAEIESAFVAHPLVAEAAVVGCPHDIKGQGIYAYVTLNHGIETDEPLRHELINWVRQQIGPIATPDHIQWAPGLPKTRSGKIMRRILRKIAAGEVDSLGDISTLADPTVVETLIRNRRQ